MSKISQWMQELDSGDARQQARAAELLATVGPDAQAAIVALVQACGAQNEGVRNWCTAALEQIGPPAASQIADLTALANSANGDIAFWAVTLLGRAGSRAARAVPILQQRLSDEATPAVQQRAAWALQRIEAA